MAFGNLVPQQIGKVVIQEQPAQQMDAVADSTPRSDVG
jgi:hypothetical protein